MSNPKPNSNGQPHVHGHGHGSGSRGRLSIVLLLTAIYMIAELVGGMWTGSLALLADAGHMLADVAALILALMAVLVGARPGPPRQTFCLYPPGSFGALLNSGGPVLVSFFIFF